ncbi:MAG TPA: hypothetical protein VNO83_00365, partial [Pseudonocardia sp.]|nr:hypothetical protein [Pseudonocardia sp.]
YLMWLLTFRAAGMGLCMMPIMTGGIAVIPPSLVSHAGAFNNVVQRTTAALGLAVLTAMVSNQQSQQIEDRTALIPAGTPMPQLGPDAGEGVAGLLAVYQETQNQVFVSALNDMYIVTAIVTAAGVVLALMLHHGPAPAAPQDPTPEAREPEPAAEAARRNGHERRLPADRIGSNGAGERETVPSAAGTGERDTSAARR